MLTAEYDYDTDIEVQREEAFAEGEDSFAKLTEMLLKDSKTEELSRAAKDKTYRKALYLEYKIKE